VTAVSGAEVVRTFLGLAERFDGESQWTVRWLSEHTGVPLRERPSESGSGYRVYRGSGLFAGTRVTAELRAPNRPSAASPLLLVLDLPQHPPLEAALTEEYGPPDTSEPPSPHGPPDDPEYSGYRRGQVLASIGVSGDQVTGLVLQAPWAT
jgi:hypothetical protein